MKKFTIVLLSIILWNCSSKEQVDLIVTNANAYTVNDDFTKAEAFAVQDGKFVAVGSTADIQEKYQATETIDVKGKTVLPGFIDAHCHFYGLGQNQQVVDLVGTKSFDEVLERLQTSQKEKNSNFLRGRGWDQNDWEVKKFPTKDRLDELYPNIPVAIERVDGHAYLVNQKALDMAGITANTHLEGGEIVKHNGQLTGVLVDSPMEMIDDVIPETNRATKIQALLDAQKICVDLGLTTVSDAGLDKDIIELIDSLHQTGDLQMRIYAMISNKKENLDHYLSKGKVKTDRLNVQSVKVYGDGALGSRGAALKESYSDKANHFGAMVTSPKNLEALAARIAKSDYQMNTHAIGDSANGHILKTYDKFLKGQTNRRWRIEHAQVIDQSDFDYFKNENIIPSVQPTHATSDMYWAGDRLGDERVKGAYAFKDLLDLSGKVALGTDFPVERVSPFLTFYAAVSRQDLENYPEGGFQMENALSREETLKGMTIWAAYSNFEENEKGSIEVGKFADFIILDQDIMTVSENKIPEIKVEKTYIDGVAQ